MTDLSGNFLGFFVKSDKVRQVATWITLPGVSKLAHYKIFPRKNLILKLTLESGALPD